MIDASVFKDVSYGMYIITTKEKEKRVGCVINTLTQITAKDQIVTISLNKENYTNLILKKSKKCIISILSVATSKEVISKFGYFTSRLEDKFKDVIYEEDEGLPYVSDQICSYIIADVLEVVDCGSHDIFILKTKKAVNVSSLEPMTYKYYQENLKGKAPEKAPTYMEETGSSTACRYRCLVCGYIYDDAKEKIKFVDLDDDWKCPRCGVSKDKFVKID